MNQVLSRRLGAALAVIWLLTAQLAPAATLAADGAGGGLAATTTDPAGTTLIGACFELYTDAGGGTRGSLVANSKRCDQPVRTGDQPIPNDGVVDGTTPWTGLAAGGYVVVETLGPAHPQAGTKYETAPDTAVTVSTGAVTRLILVHRPTAGLTIHKVDAAGRPLTGACFVLITTDNRQVGGVCDGPTVAGQPTGADRAADGLLVIPGLAPTLEPTTYTLREIVAPPGYTPAADQQVIADPARPTELTISNTTGGPPAPPPTAGPMEVTGLDLEIDSTITIRLMQGQPASGTAKASGLIKLTTRNADGVWSGTGTLAASTDVAYSTSCVVTTITGDGTYDWVVTDAHAGAGGGATITVGMNNGGTTSENPDTISTDSCGTTFEPSTANTWENLFFNVYHQNHVDNGGFRVDGWTILDPAAWTNGGPVAEAHWSGDCVDPPMPDLPGMSVKILDCTDATTFRLIVHVGPSTSGGPPAPVATVAPGASPAAGQSSAPIATSPTDGNFGGVLADCTDAPSCLSRYWIIALLGVGVVAGGGLLLVQRLIRSPGTALADGPLDAGKFEPIADKGLPLDAGKFEPIADKGLPLESQPLGDNSLSPLEPPSQELPPPPGRLG